MAIGDMTNVTTGEVRLSYAHLFKPYSNIEGQEPKYSVTVLLPKTDTATKGRIDAAIEAGLKVKLNTVALRGVNDDELINLLEFARAADSQIRFIEYMENSHAKEDLKGLKSDEILTQDYHISSAGCYPFQAFCLQ